MGPGPVVGLLLGVADAPVVLVDRLVEAAEGVLPEPLLPQPAVATPIAITKTISQSFLEGARSSTVRECTGLAVVSNHFEVPLRVMRAFADHGDDVEMIEPAAFSRQDDHAVPAPANALKQPRHGHDEQAPGIA